MILEKLGHKSTIAGLVSTVIPVHNRAAMLSEAVTSVLVQSYRPVEVIVSDDGSTDDTLEAARALEREHPGVVTALANPKRGAGPAREAGRLRARGEFIQYLDSDDRLLPEKFATQVQALRDHPECGAAYGWIRFCPEEGPPNEAPFKLSGKAMPYLFPRLLVDRWWNTDCPLFRRSVCDAVGPWSDLRYSQDWEHDARVGALGTRLVHTPIFVCEQRHHANQRQTGHGGWLPAADQVRFFRTLLDCARRAGVAPDAPELRHFSRWVFAQARICAGELKPDGDAVEALLCIANAAVPAGARDIALFDRFGAVLGWSVTARLAQAAYRLRGGRPGRDTLRPSWAMRDEDDAG